MKHIFNLIFAESATMISMHSNFLITLTYQVFCAYLLFLNSACIGFKMRFHVFATGPLFSWSISGNWGMYLFTYPYNVLCNYWVFMCFSDNLGIFDWLLSVLRCSSLQFQICLTSLFLPSLLCLAHAQQHNLDNDLGTSK